MGLTWGWCWKLKIFFPKPNLRSLLAKISELFLVVDRSHLADVQKHVSNHLVWPTFLKKNKKCDMAGSGRNPCLVMPVWGWYRK